MNSSLPQSIIQQAWMSQPESEGSVSSCLLGGYRAYCYYYGSEISSPLP
jgi:hypothetical protein